jgi:glycosyltransferase involved in cell wall biosynthesis
MLNISNDSLAKERNLPEVEVLLATLNGEKYVEEFLRSLSKQEGVKIHLRVSDDGSTDGTLGIVDSYSHFFETCKILEGPRRGPGLNFFYLISQAKLGFVALADQDDIWFPNHLHDSIIRLLNTQEMPSMTFSSVLEFEDTNVNVKRWPGRFPDNDIRSILTENLGRGCTFVFNSKAINLINFYKPKNAIMHDWWILLLISCTGNVSWSHSPEIQYRIHPNNSVGRTPRFKERLGRFLKTSMNGRWMVIDQIDELLRNYGPYMQPKSRDVLSLFLIRYSSKSKIERMKLFAWTGRYRSTLIDEIAVRMVLLTRKNHILRR